MEHEVLEVCFPGPVLGKILARGIAEEEVLEALQADPDLGDGPPLLFAKGTGRRGGSVFWGLCRVPSSGRYLEVGFELMEDGTAWCYHAMDMRRRARRRYERER
jgi:hypothetical protein